MGAESGVIIQSETSPVPASTSHISVSKYTRVAKTDLYTLVLTSEEAKLHLLGHKEEAWEEHPNS